MGIRQLDRIGGMNLKEKIAGTGSVKGYEFRLVKLAYNNSNKPVFIYQQWCSERDKHASYEVFMPRMRGGKYIYPGSSEWGIRAWTFLSLEKAEKRFQKLLNNGI